MDNHTIGAMAERIERLEKQCRLWRWVGSAIILVLAIILAMGSVRRDEVPKVIRAENFVAVDKNGEAVIGMGTSIVEKGRGLIEFRDNDRKQRVAIGFGDDDRPFILLADSSGREKLILDVHPKLGMGIAFRNRRNDSALMLGTDSGGIAALGFMGEGGNLLIEMGVNPDGSAHLILRDKDRKELFRVPQP
jgi:hypothetical protein